MIEIKPERPAAFDSYSVKREKDGLESKSGENHHEVLGIVKRRLNFDFEDNLSAIFNPKDPELCFFLLAGSLIVGGSEPYAIRTFRKTLKHVANPKLKKEIEAFLYQETEHYKQHKIYNDKALFSRYEGLKEILKEYDALCRGFTKENSLKFNVAYVERLEVFTLALAVFLLQKDGFIFEVDCQKSDLWKWHMIEEIEHRAVCHDTYEELYGDYFFKLKMSFVTGYYYVKWLRKVRLYILSLEKENLKKNYGGSFMHYLRTLGVWSRLIRKLFPNVVRSLLPWESPHKVKILPVIETIKKQIAPRIMRVVN